MDASIKLFCTRVRVRRFDRAERRKSRSSQIGREEAIADIVLYAKAAAIILVEANDIGKEHQRTLHLMVCVDVVTVARTAQAVSIGAEVACWKSLDLNRNAGTVQNRQRGAKRRHDPTGVRG